MIHLRAGVNALAVLAVAARAKMTEAMNFMVRKGCFCCGCWCGRCWIFMGDTVIDARLVEVFRSQYIFALRQQT